MPFFITQLLVNLGIIVSFIFIDFNYDNHILMISVIFINSSWISVFLVPQQTVERDKGVGLRILKIFPIKNEFVFTVKFFYFMTFYAFHCILPTLLISICFSIYRKINISVDVYYYFFLVMSLTMIILGILSIIVSLSKYKIIKSLVLIIPIIFIALAQHPDLNKLEEKVWNWIHFINLHFSVFHLVILILMGLSIILFIGIGKKYMSGENIYHIYN